MQLEEGGAWILWLQRNLAERYFCLAYSLSSEKRQIDFLDSGELLFNGIFRWLQTNSQLLNFNSIVLELLRFY